MQLSAWLKVRILPGPLFDHLGQSIVTYLLWKYRGTIDSKLANMRGCDVIWMGIYRFKTNSVG